MLVKGLGRAGFLHHIAGCYSTGSSTTTLSGSKCRIFSVTTVKPCAFAVAAIMTSPSPGCLPRAVASSSICPAILATGMSIGRMRSSNVETIPSTHCLSRDDLSRAPRRSRFPIPFSISAIVMVDRNNLSAAPCSRIHAVKAIGGAGLSGANFEITSVSSR